MCVLIDVVYLGYESYSRPLTVLVGNTTTSDTIVHTGYPNDIGGNYWIELDPPMLLETIRVENNVTSRMALCEILVYDTGRSCDLVVTMFRLVVVFQY